MRATRRFLRLGGIWRIGVGRLDGLRADALRTGSRCMGLLHPGALRRPLGAWLGVCAVVLGLLLSACDVHQFPEQHPGGPDIDPDPTEPPVSIPLGLVYEPDFYVWPHRYDPVLGSVEASAPVEEPFPSHPGTSSRYSNILSAGVLLVHVRAYTATGTSRCVAQQTFTRSLDGLAYDMDLDFDVPAGGVYDIVVWSHLLADDDAAAYYDFDDFNRVHLVASGFEGNTDLRDAFRGTIRINAADAIEDRYVIRMQRPMGKFELITTDLSEFLEREGTRRNLASRADPGDYVVVIAYPMYYPASYSAIEDRLENVYTGMQFETRMTVTGDSEASLGFDYVLLNNVSDAGVQVAVSVYDLAGTRVAGSSTFTVPMRRDHHTVLRGAFLSMPGNGGVGIDPGFNGDHNVTW